MTTSKKTPKQNYEVRVTYTSVIAYVSVTGASLEDALAQSENLEFGMLLVDGLSNILDYEGRVSGVFESV